MHYYIGLHGLRASHVIASGMTNYRIDRTAQIDICHVDVVEFGVDACCCGN